MAYIKKRRWGGGNSDPYYSSSFKAVFDALPASSIYSVTDSGGNLYITVNNEMHVELGNNDQHTYAWYGEGSPISYSYINGWNPANLIVAASDDLLYIHFWNEYGNGRRFVFLAEKIDDNWYYGAIGSGNGANDTHVWYNPSDFSIISHGETDISVIHGNRLNYTGETGKLEYTGDIVISNGIKVADDPNFKSCTTVNNGKIITINGTDYLSVGTHTLLKRDPIPTT